LPRSTTRPAPEAVDTTTAPGGWDHDDGTSVEVLSIRSFTLGRGAVGGRRGQPGVAVKVRVTNGGSIRWYVSVGHTALILPGGRAAAPVLDVGSGVEGALGGHLAPGRSRTSEFGFLTDGRKHPTVTLHLAPDTGEAAGFRGRVA
jgi:hypothetical protein